MLEIRGDQGPIVRRLSAAHFPTVGETLWASSIIKIKLAWMPEGMASLMSLNASPCFAQSIDVISRG